MQILNRRNAIKAGLMGAATLPLLPINNAEAQPNRTWIDGHRVVQIENNVFGLSSSRIVYSGHPRLPELTGANPINGGDGNENYMHHVARLLEASRDNSYVSLDGEPNDYFYSQVERVLQHEGKTKEILADNDTSFYWADIIPTILVFVVPGALAARILGMAGIAFVLWTLRPYLDSFDDKPGRDARHWMEQAIP